MSVVTVLVIGVSILFAGALLFPLAVRLSRVKYVAQGLSFPLLLVGGGLLAVLICLLLLLGTGANVWASAAGIWGAYTVVALVQWVRLGLKNKPLSETPTDLTILGWNTLGDSVSVEYMRDVILDRRPDAVGLPETTTAFQEALVAALAAAGYGMRGFTVGPQDGHDPHETSLLIKASYGEYTIQRLNVLGASTLEATPANETSPTFVAVHTVAPRPEWHRAWQQDLKILAARYETAVNTILVGDFNATVLHMRDLGGLPYRVLGGFADAATTVGAAGLGTWPVNKPLLLGTQIDHVLYTGEYGVEGFRVLTEYDDSGSDHRAVLASLKRRD